MRRVIAAFPATGKTYVATHGDRFTDSDSSRFPRGEAWPDNYIQHIYERAAQGDTVLASTHAEVRNALVTAKIPFTLVYPDEGCRDEYVRRMEDRGSPASLVATVAENWRDWISELRLQHGCDHYVLTNGEYLSDMLERCKCVKTPCGSERPWCQWAGRTDG